MTIAQGIACYIFAIILVGYFIVVEIMNDHNDDDY